MATFANIRVAVTVESLYQDYYRHIRQTFIFPPHGRIWFAKLITDSPDWMRRSHPDLYTDLGL